MLTDLEDQRNTLTNLALQLKSSQSDEERAEKLNAFLGHTKPLHSCPKAEFILKSLVAIGQKKLLSKIYSDELVTRLLPVETFYREMGGIVGYHATMLSLLLQKEKNTSMFFHRPHGIDMATENGDVQRWVIKGIETLGQLAEMYPVGGAADRLKLCDPISGKALPAAKLSFCGKTLLESLIRDVQAREYLHYKLFGKQVQIPIALMTSPEKENHRYIVELCEKNHWFGRHQSAFRLFCQPLVPGMDKEGNWCLSSDGKLMMKPGGHGAIWKVAKEEGVFDWFQNLGKKKILVRQINNPIAGVDYGLLGFTGIGFSQDKKFGFASCPRQVGSAEGVNIILEKRNDDKSHYSLTNIEYCDFAAFDIQDKADQPSNSYSAFPSNTNILFADIAAVIDRIQTCPIPGMLVNFKKMSVLGDTGSIEEKEVARLESTMQNLADAFVHIQETQAPFALEQLETYLTFNHRKKTLSTTKKQWQKGNSLLETPEGCFLDQLFNAHELLTQYCHFTLPPMDPIIPSFLFSYHPSLGPLYSIIAQKLRRGSFGLYSELKLEITEIDIQNIHLSGSLHIIAQNIMGERDSQGILHYSSHLGKCTLKDVQICNRGIDREASNCYWSENIQRSECCLIEIRGSGEFVAENVQLRGNLHLIIESDTRVRAYEENGEVKFSKEILNSSTPYWQYTITDNAEIVLVRQQA